MSVTYCFIHNSRFTDARPHGHGRQNDTIAQSAQILKTRRHTVKTHNYYGSSWRDFNKKYKVPVSNTLFKRSKNVHSVRLTELYSLSKQNKQNKLCKPPTKLKTNQAPQNTWRKNKLKDHVNSFTKGWREGKAFVYFEKN